jgi:transcriptional regulator with XRE-family HTH domain
MKEPETIERIGHRIKVRRVEQKMLQEELARKVGMAQSQLSKIERGQLGLDVIQLLAIAEALSCSAAYLLGEESRKAA